MKELRKECHRLAESLERRWTRQEDKWAAATLLRNCAGTQSVCNFCGIGEGEYGRLFESWYDPTVRICLLCIRELAMRAPGKRVQADEGCAAQGQPEQAGGVLPSQIEEKTPADTDAAT